MWKAPSRLKAAEACRMCQALTSTSTSNIGSGKTVRLPRINVRMASEVDRSAGRPPHDSNPLTSPVDARRIRILRGLIGALFVGLIVSLAYVQLERSAEYVALGR